MATASAHLRGSADAAASGSPVPYCADPKKYDATMDAKLISSTDMPAQQSQITVAVPINVLTEYLFLGRFTEWNSLFNTQATPPENVTLCGGLDAVYSNGQFLGPILPKNIVGPHYIIQKGCANSCPSSLPGGTVVNGSAAAPCTCAIGWWFNILTVPENELITFGRHTYTLMSTSNNETVVASYERAAGSNVAANSQPWTNALQESLIQGIQGMVCLERYYQEHGVLDAAGVASFCTHFIA